MHFSDVASKYEYLAEMPKKKSSTKTQGDSGPNGPQQHKAVAYACKCYEQEHGNLPDNVRWKFEDAPSKKHLRSLLEKYEVEYNTKEFNKLARERQRRPNKNAVIETKNSVRSIGTPMRG